MKPKSILDLIFFLISILSLFVLKYLNKIFKQIKNEIKNESFQNNGNDNENICYYIAYTKNHEFKFYKYTNRLSFNFRGVIEIKGGSVGKVPKKIIIYFDDKFQLKYKNYIIKYINAADEEKIRPIYKK